MPQRDLSLLCTRYLSLISSSCLSIGFILFFCRQGDERGKQADWKETKAGRGEAVPIILLSSIPFLASTTYPRGFCIILVVFLLYFRRLVVTTDAEIRVQVYEPCRVILCDR